MGQRSQIYVRITDKNGNRYYAARYFQWNYGERMVSRARSIMEWISDYRNYLDFFTNENQQMEKKRLTRIIDTNFDMRDSIISHDIFREVCELNGDPTDCISAQDNNDGQLFIDVTPEGTRYALTPYTEALDSGCTILNARAYLVWDFEYELPDKIDEEKVKKSIGKGNWGYTKRNIAWIEKNAKLMTAQELREMAEDIISYQSALLNPVPFH